MSLTGDDLDRLIYTRQLRLSLLGPQQRPIWEASPSTKHQLFVRNIERTIQAAPASGGCVCDHVADAYIQLPDNSLVRPDIAIFCEPIPALMKAYRATPAAVIEIVSPNYEAKDYIELPPTYLINGVLDILIVDPRKGAFTHFRPGVEAYRQSLPQSLTLTCGCTVTIPK